GLIIDADVLAGQDEGAQTLLSMDRIAQALGQNPQRLLGDGAFGSGSNLAGLAARGIEGFIPQSQRASIDNPAQRDDPAIAVPREQWDRLPLNARSKRLDRA